MQSIGRASAFALCLATSLAASGALAADDPYAQQPQPQYQAPPPVVMGGTAQAGQPVQPQPVQPATNQEEHAGIYFQGRLGPSIPLLGPLAAAGAIGGTASGIVGFQAREGYGAGIELGGRAHFGSSSAWGFHAAATFRYTALPELAIHPFAEFSFGLQVLGVSHDVRGGEAAVGYYLSGALGLEYDLTSSLSLDLLVRADLLPSGSAWGSSSTVPTAGGNRVFDVPISPMVGLTLYR
jgi:hypothetical protein